MYFRSEVFARKTIVTVIMKSLNIEKYGNYKLNKRMKDLKNRFDIRSKLI